MLSICSWHNSCLTRLQSRSILQVRILETTFSVSFFFVFSGAAVVAWGWQLIPGERRLLYQIVPKQQPTAPGRISVKSCWKSIGKPPHKIPLQLLIWAKTCCLYFGPLSSRIFDCHWQETSSLSLHLNFTNINVTPSTLWKIICDQPHTHLNILGGSSRQNHQAFWWHPYQGSYDHPWNPFRSDEVPHGPRVQTWWVIGELWMYPSRWPRLSHTLEMECQHSTTLKVKGKLQLFKRYFSYLCVPFIQRLIPIGINSEVICFSPHTTSRNSWHCCCWHLSRLWLLQALGSVHPHQLKTMSSSSSVHSVKLQWEYFHKLDLFIDRVIDRIISNTISSGEIISCLKLGSLEIPVGLLVLNFS